VNFIIRLVVNAAALLLVAYFLPGVHVSSIGSALLVALILGLVNAVLGPILFVLTLPLQILTLGLFTLFINGFLFWWIAQWHLGLTVAGYWTAFLAAIVLSIVSFLLSLIVRGIESAV
jgi:putative membrane protein